MLRMGSTLASVVSTIYLPYRRGNRLMFVVTENSQGKKHHAANAAPSHIAIARVFAIGVPSNRPNRIVSTVRPAFEATAMVPTARVRSIPMKRQAPISFGLPRQPVYENMAVQVLAPTFQYEASEEVSGKLKTISKINKRTIVKTKAWAHIETPHVDDLVKEVIIQHPNTIVYGEFSLRDKPYNAIIANFRGDAEFHATSKNGRWNITKAKNIGFTNR